VVSLARYNWKETAGIGETALHLPSDEFMLTNWLLDASSDGISAMLFQPPNIIYFIESMIWSILQYSRAPLLVGLAVVSWVCFTILPYWFHSFWFWYFWQKSATACYLPWKKLLLGHEKSTVKQSIGVLILTSGKPLSFKKSLRAWFSLNQFSASKTLTSFLCIHPAASSSASPTYRLPLPLSSCAADSSKMPRIYLY